MILRILSEYELWVRGTPLAREPAGPGAREG